MSFYKIHTRIFLEYVDFRPKIGHPYFVSLPCKLDNTIFFIAVSFRLISGTLHENQCFIGKVHLERHGKKYHFSWLEVGENRKFTWEQARNYCRRFCMDAISIQSVAEYNTVKEQLRKSEYLEQRFISPISTH